VADELGINPDQLLAQPEKRYRAKIKINGKIAWPTAIKGLRLP
jgi:hypothetical protein